MRPAMYAPSGSGTESFEEDWAGVAECISHNSANTICFHWHLKMDTADGPYDSDQRKHLVCHEGGHAFGLRHIGAGGCVAPGSWSVKNWDSHDNFHINSYY